MTTRQEYKKAAMQSLLLDPQQHPLVQIVEMAAQCADAMLAEDEAHAAKSAPSPTTHNPDKLTPEQIGTAEGWRLLDSDEIKEDRDFTIKIERWLVDGWDNTEWRGGKESGTYRTRLTREELAKLP